MFCDDVTTAQPNLAAEIMYVPVGNASNLNAPLWSETTERPPTRLTVTPAIPAFPEVEPTLPVTVYVGWTYATVSNAVVVTWAHPLTSNSVWQALPGAPVGPASGILDAADKRERVARKRARRVGAQDVNGARRNERRPELRIRSLAIKFNAVRRIGAIGVPIGRFEAGLPTPPQSGALAAGHGSSPVP